MVVENESKALTGNNEEPEEEEDLVDPQETMKSNCSDKSQCQSYKSRLDECTERVNSHPNTEETCTEELFDFIHCVDSCVSKELFKVLK